MANYNVSGLITLAELAKLKKILWYVYILKCGDNTYYTGITNNIKNRIANHENGTGAKYTRGRGPFVLVFQESCQDRSNASQRERQIKKLSLEQKKKLIEST